MIANTRSVTFATVLRILVVFLIAVTQAKAGPLSVQRRKNLDVYNPRVIEPSGNTAWEAGKVELVTW